MLPGLHMISTVYFFHKLLKSHLRDCKSSNPCSLLSALFSVVRALASHQCSLDLIPGLSIICGLSLLLVLFSAPRGFSLGPPALPPPQKPTLPNSNLIRIQWMIRATMWMSTAKPHLFVIYLFCDLFIISLLWFFY